MELIQKWLEGKRNFASGRILYNQYGSDNKFKCWLAEGETPDKKKQLVLTLQAILLTQEPKAAEKVESSLNKLPAGNSPVEQAIHEDWKQHYTRMNMLRGKLQSYGEDNSPETVHQCNTLCQQILGEEQYINACWDKLKHYQEHGKLPEEKEEHFEIPVDPVALAKLIETLTRNIRRNKQKAATDPANPLYPALVKKYEQQLQMITDAKKN